MNKPKKLIRSSITNLLKREEWETITDKAELNDLYATKIREELAEVQASNHQDINEFADLVEVAMAFAEVNGFSFLDVQTAREFKNREKGSFGKLALNNLNPENPSNKLYFDNPTPMPWTKSDLDRVIRILDNIDITEHYVFTTKVEYDFKYKPVLDDAFELASASVMNKEPTPVWVKSVYTSGMVSIYFINLDKIEASATTDSLRQ